MNEKGKACRRVAIFLAVLIAGSAYFENRIMALGGCIQNHLDLIVALVWWVTVSSIVARLILREGFSDVSFRWGGAKGTRAIVLAMPLVVGFTSYGIAWSTGLANFKRPGSLMPFWVSTSRLPRTRLSDFCSALEPWPCWERCRLANTVQVKSLAGVAIC